MTVDIRLNPRLSSDAKEIIQSTILNLDASDCTWLLSSGTESRTGEYKIIGLSLEGMAIAAEAVNTEMHLTKTDIFHQAIPPFHVGGLMVEQRAKRLNAKWIPWLDQKWSALSFLKVIQDELVTVSSLVPTQIYDLIHGDHAAPDRLKCIFVGGGHLDEATYRKAIDLGWPLVLTYGMTETCAMVAYKKDYNEPYQTFPHVKWQLNAQSELMFKGEYLFEQLVVLFSEDAHLQHPKQAGWYTTSDIAKVRGRGFDILGRGDDFAKINGESVSLVKIRNHFSEHFGSDVVILAVEDSRSGQSIVAVSEKNINQQKIDELNQSLLPFERVQSLHTIKTIPKTVLGKVKLASLRELLLRSSD